MSRLRLEFYPMVKSEIPVSGVEEICLPGFYAPNFEKVEVEYCFSLVRPPVHLLKKVS